MTVVNARGFRYADAIRQEQQLCAMKSEPVTVRKLIKAIHENFRLKGGENGYENVVARKIETVLSASEAKKCYKYGETGHMAIKCPHKKNGFSAQNGQFTCHLCGGIGHNLPNVENMRNMRVYDQKVW